MADLFDTPIADLLDTPIETYIFLGTQLNTHFFLHMTDEEKYIIDIPAQIYNVLIHDKFITDPTENVVIYSFNKKCEIIIIQHTDNKKNNRFSKNNLESFFEILLEAPKDIPFVIIYFYEKSFYKTFQTGSELSVPNGFKFNNSRVVSIVTLKPIVNS